MNIIDTQNDLKNFSEEQLIKEMQQPTGNAPQFLVLGEMNRRKNMRNEQALREAEANDTTVAEDALAGAGVPQQGIMSMAKSMAPNSNVTQNTGVQQAQKPQGYAQGGVVGYANGGSVYAEYADEWNNNPRFVEIVKMSNPELFQKLLDHLGPPMTTASTSTGGEALSSAIDVSDNPSSVTPSLMQQAPHTDDRPAALKPPQGPSNFVPEHMGTGLLGMTPQYMGDGAGNFGPTPPPVSSSHEEMEALRNALPEPKSDPVSWMEGLANESLVPNQRNVPFEPLPLGVAPPVMADRAVEAMTPQPLIGEAESLAARERFDNRNSFGSTGIGIMGSQPPSLPSMDPRLERTKDIETPPEEPFDWRKAILDGAGKVDDFLYDHLIPKFGGVGSDTGEMLDPSAPNLIPPTAPPAPPAPPAPTGNGGGGGGGSSASGLGGLADQLAKERDKDRWLALARAGFAMMSTNSEHFGDALGAGGIAGLDAMEEANARYEEGLVSVAKLQADAAKAAAKASGSSKDDYDVGDLIDAMKLRNSDQWDTLTPEVKDQVNTIIAVMQSALGMGLNTADATE